jgi:hypothetical protein
MNERYSMSGQHILSQLKDVLANLDILQGRIRTGYATKETTDPATVQQELELYKTTSQKTTYDAKFLEEQYPYQRSPKRRTQTLQEFVLLFFYVSFAIFSVALIIYAFLEGGQSYSAAGKMLGLCLVLCLAITAILIRVA